MRLSDVQVTDIVTVVPFILKDGLGARKYHEGYLLPEENEPGIIVGINKEKRVIVEFGGPERSNYHQFTFWPSELLPAA